MIEDGKLACYNNNCKYWEESPYENGFCKRVEKGQATAIGSKHIRVSVGDDILVDVWIPVCIFYDSSKQTIKDHITENNLLSGDSEENYGNNKSMWGTYEMCQELKRAKREEKF